MALDPGYVYSHDGEKRQSLTNPDETSRITAEVMHWGHMCWEMEERVTLAGGRGKSGKASLSGSCFSFSYRIRVTFVERREELK